MATRPVFVPDTDPGHTQLVHEIEVDFQWAAGMEPETRKTNVARLHAGAAHRKLENLLEVSPFGKDPFGAQVAPARLTVKDDASYFVSLIPLYHGSKVFSGGGPYTDLYRKSEEEILGDERLTESGRFVGFRFQGLEWGLKSGTMFYDWLTLHAIDRNRNLSSAILKYAGFTDVGCLLREAGICHARSCALYVALVGKKILNEVSEDQDKFIRALIKDPFYQA